jgi:Holliday junction resolvase RusA-like endonuclease
MLAAKMAHKKPLFDGPVHVDLEFVFSRPAAKVWKRKPMRRLWHVVKPDTDNLQKLVFDAIKKVVWVDDSQVCSQSVVKVIATGSERPGVYVVVTPLESDPAGREKHEH